MTFVSITAVAAFDAVGSILVVAMMVAPSAAAYLLTDRLRDMILLSVALGAVAAVGGFQMARLFDVSIAGAMATASGIVFLCVWLGAPRYGILAGRQRRIRQKWEFAEKMLAIHLFNHEGLPEADIEHRIGHLEEHLAWERDFAQRVVRRAQSNGLVQQADDDMLVLTPRGREAASEAIDEPVIQPLSFVDLIRVSLITTRARRRRIYVLRAAHCGGYPYSAGTPQANGTVIHVHPRKRDRQAPIAYTILNVLLRTVLHDQVDRAQAAGFEGLEVGHIQQGRYADLRGIGQIGNICPIIDELYGEGIVAHHRGISA